ncbi:MAG TPA: amino acid adenylation domain-containing protein, partial [Ktedonobacteraceae bacterium]|nr:amino acid adenylation domain-containing protein [Ktedonobacteraceae bacterium]
MSVSTLKGFPLSMQQVRLYTLHEDIQAYRVFCRVLVNGSLNNKVLQLALSNIISRHSILRTRFYSPPGMDVPMQVVSSQAEMVYEERDLSDLTEEEQITQVMSLSTEMKKRPFDLESGPPIHVLLIRTEAQAYQLCLSLSALCADTVTLRLILTELSQMYRTILHEDTSADEPLLQYTDVSAWQDDLLREDDAAAPLAYWNQIDLKKLYTQPLPFHSGSASGREFQQGEQTALQQLTLQIPAEEMLQLQQFTQQSGIPLETILLTTWQIALSRLVDQTELIIGIACDGRNYQELETTLGCCTRVVPLAAYFNSERTFIQCAESMRIVLAQVREQQTYFSWRTQETSRELQSLFFPLAFEYAAWPQSWKTDTFAFACVEESNRLEPHILKLRGVQTGEACRLEWHYDPAYFTDRRIERLAHTVLALLKNALIKPSEPVGHLELLDETERERLLVRWRGPHTPLVYQPLTRLLEKNAAQTPSALAVICSEQSLTYEQLNQRANRLAHWLQKRGVGPDILVGLYAERSIDTLVGLLGILKAGGAYVPLDPALPTARLEQQFTQTELPVLLTQESLLGQLPTFAGQILCLDRDAALLTTEAASNLEITPEAEHLAYVIYTSGSTGSPKGVAIRQLGISNYVQDMCRRVAPEIGLHFATVSTFAADLGNTAIFCSLVSGGCLHILPYTTVTSSEAFARYTDGYPIDVLKIVPSHLSALLTGEQGARILPRRSLILGGEVLPWSLIYQLQAAGCSCEVLNHYGPTETTIGVLVNELGSLVDNREDGASVPLGLPLANTHFVIVDRNNCLVPVEVPGELWIGGNGLARGYLSNPQLTQQSFVSSTFLATPVRYYRTGDRVRYTDQGQLEFLGRIDRQIKLRGYRIEPGDIEAILKQHSRVRESIVSLRNNPPEEPKLVAYVLLAGSQAQSLPEGAEFRRFLSEKLPTYMQPSVIIPLTEWPLTANGKIDYQQLKALDQPLQEKTLLAPRDQLEFTLARLWEELLHVWPISITDSFFDLGGHSLLAVSLIAQIQRVFGYDLPVTTLFQHPTIEKLATVLHHYDGAGQWQTIVPLQAGGQNPPLFCIHPAGGTSFCYYDLARHLDPEQPVYGIQAPDPAIWEQKILTVAELAEQYILALREIQPQGPYRLCGWSAGGVIAFEMACQLRSRGEEVALLALFDSSAPLTSTEPIAPPDVSDSELARSIFADLNLAPLARSLDSLPPKEHLSYVLEQGKMHKYIPQDVDIV